MPQATSTSAIARRSWFVDTNGIIHSFMDSAKAPALRAVADVGVAKDRGVGRTGPQDRRRQGTARAPLCVQESRGVRPADLWEQAGRSRETASSGLRVSSPARKLARMAPRLPATAASVGTKWRHYSFALAVPDRYRRSWPRTQIRASPINQPSGLLSRFYAAARSGRRKTKARQRRAHLNSAIRRRCVFIALP
jgi:hypothetical protein